MSILSDELLDLENDLDAARRKVANNPGPLDEPVASEVDDLLTSADTHLKAALSILGIAGEATESMPPTLPAIAQECRLVAQQAYESATSGSPDNQFIANQLATIDWMVNASGGYKDRAGL